MSYVDWRMSNWGILSILFVKKSKAKRHPQFVNHHWSFHVVSYKNLAPLMPDTWHLHYLTTCCQIKSAKGLNPDNPEITNNKHQILNKFQITITKSQTRSKAKCLEFGILVIVICPSTWLRVVVSLSNHLVFVFCYLVLVIFYFTVFNMR